MKKEAKLLASEVAELKEGRGDEDLRYIVTGIVQSLPQAPGIVCGRGYKVGVIFFSSKNEIVVTVSKMFENGPVETECVFRDTLSTSGGRLENSKSRCEARI